LNRLTKLKWKAASRNEVNPMAVCQRRYSKEELAQRGQALYETSIRQQVEPGNEGKIVAIGCMKAFHLLNFGWYNNRHSRRK
jgi:hypothetical protein